MTHTDILEIAQETAGRLGIKIKDTALVLRNMKYRIGPPRYCRFGTFHRRPQQQKVQRSFSDMRAGLTLSPNMRKMKPSKKGR